MINGLHANSSTSTQRDDWPEVPLGERVGLRGKPEDARGVHRVGRNPDAEKGEQLEEQAERSKGTTLNPAGGGVGMMQEEAGLCSVGAARGFCFLSETGKGLHFESGELGSRLG